MPPRRRPLLPRLWACLVVLVVTGGGARADDDDSPGALLNQARRAAGEQKVSAAIDLYFRALRAADDYATKYGIRDEVLALPSERAAPIHEGERATVAARVAEERSRDIDQQAGRMEGRGAFRGAMYLWRKLYDLEGVDDGKKKQIDATVERLTRRLCDEATDEEKAEAKTLHGDEQDPAAALARADQAAAAGKGRVALKVYSHVSYSAFASQELKDTARARIAALRKRLVEEVPPDEQAEADKVWNDPHWSYLGTAVSRQYVFIGPKTFVDSLTEPDKLKLDLACVFLGDLVGRDQVTDAGQRLSVYYKERFDFGGGLGGGHRIDIGNKVITRPIAGELHFHETSHCVFNVGMIYKGFIEGIANFGATFALDALGRHAEADAAIASNRKGYKDDYLDRRVRYWRIASYAPSCGFLFTPITAKDPVARQAEWAKYRQFFRRVRQTMPDEPRDAERIRYFAWLWGKTFGFQMIDEAAKARFPVVPADRERVEAELSRWYEETSRGESYAEQEFHGMAVEPLEAVIAGCPPGQLVDRAKFALARVKEGLGELPARDALYKELGVVPAWKLCLPFYSVLRGLDALHAVFEPERETVLAAEYPNPNQTARWMDAKITPDGVVDLLEHGVGYPDDAVAYALAVLEVPADVPDAVCYVAYDDLCAMWVNRTLVEKWEGEQGWLRDDKVGAIPLKAGRNQLLLKIVNRRGPWRFSARVAHADRRPIEGLVFGKPPEKDVRPALPEWKGAAVFTLDLEKAKSLPKGRFKATVGGFDLVDRSLRVSVPGSVPWRKYEIQPFTSKHPPIALCWLTDKDLAGLTDFAVEVTTRGPGLPRLGVTLHGEERDDGLSGHTFVVSPGGSGVKVALWEYERLVYDETALAADGPEHVLKFLRRGRTLSCVVDGKVVLDAVDLPALPRPGIGLMLWDKGTAVVKVKVEKPK